MAREILNGYGVATPPPADPWWLDAIQSAAEDEIEGTFQGCDGVVALELPSASVLTGAERARAASAQAVLRDAWVKEADLRPITQVTHPDVVHEFLDEMPGLIETALNNPSFLAAYAPQLTIPGFGGAFESIFDEWVEDCRRRGRLSDTIALHAPDHFRTTESSIVCTFVQGEIMGPSVKFYEIADHMFWTFSDASAWLPVDVREMFVRGFGDWDSRMWTEHDFERKHPEYPVTGALWNQV